MIANYNEARQVWDLALSSAKARYRETLFGFIWVILNPLLMYCVNAFVFKIILKLDIEFYYLFLLSGLLPWVFITSTTTMTVTTFQTSRNLITSFNINPFVLLASKILDNFINFTFPFLLLLIFCLFKYEVNWDGIMMLPIAVIFLFVGTCLFSLIFSTLQVFFKDLVFVNQFIVSFMYFATPIFYPKDYIPEDLLFLTYFNPYFLLIEPFQIGLWNYDYGLYLEALGRALICLVLLTAFFFIFWRRKRMEFYESL